MTDFQSSTVNAGDRQYMGSAADAKSALVEKARAWRETRQPSMATPREHREAEIREHQLRFEVANAAALWLWHEENPEPGIPAQAARSYFDGDLVNRQCKLGDYCKCCAGKPCLCPNYEGPGAIAQLSRDTLEHARARFQCLADEFEKSGDNTSWAMCSVDAERMERALSSFTSTERARGASSSDGSSRDPATTPESPR